MGTPLTGSTVASTYTGLLKTTDNATLTSTLKSLCDGGGNDSALQVSTTAANVAGDFSVATNKLTVASASGNTAVAGTLNVTGATSLSSLTTSGNATIGGTLGITGGLTIPGTLSVTGASTLTGAVGMGSTLNVTGASTLASLGVTGAATVGTTLGVTGLSTLGSLTVTGATNFNTTNTSGLSTLAELDNLGDAAIGGTLDVTGSTTLGSTLGVTGNTNLGGTLGVTGNATLSGNLSVNGNTTIGNAAGDSLTVTAGAVTINNLPAKTTPVDADTVLIRDSAASNALKTASVSSLGVVKFVYSEGFSKAGGGGQTIAITAGGGGYAIQEGGSTSDWTYTWSPKTVGNKALIRVSVPVEVSVQGSVYIGVAKAPYSVPTDYIGVGAAYASAASSSPVNVLADMVFTSTAASHTFKIFITSASQTVVIAQNSAGYYFGQTGSTLQAKVQFELIEYA
jgi:hypothetical protein